jgi:hypothetical protein
MNVFKMNSLLDNAPQLRINTLELLVVIILIIVILIPFT